MRLSKPLISILLFTFSILNSQFSIAQNLFQKAIGGSKLDEAFTIINGIDNGYIICGYTSSYGAGGKDVLIVKVDSSGNVLWAKAYGGSNDEYGVTIIATQDNAYLITAQTLSFGQGSWDGLLIKIDINGNVIWAKTYGTSLEEKLQETVESDSGFITSGETMYFNNPVKDAMIVSFDKAGNIIWAKTFSESMNTNETFYGTIMSDDSNFITTGATTSHEAKCLKFDLSGNIIWDKLYTGGYADLARSIIHANDGGYMVSGVSNSFGGGDYDCLVMKINESGTLNWAETYGGTSDDRALCINYVKNNGYIVTGNTESFGYPDSKVYTLKIDNNGNLIWSKAFGGSGWNGTSQARTWGDLRNVLLMTDNGFLIADYTESFGADNVYLIKTDSLGYSAKCATFTPPTQTQSVTLNVINGNPVIKTVPLIMAQPDLIVTNINPHDSTVCGCNLKVSLGNDTTTWQGYSIAFMPKLSSDTLLYVHYLWNDSSTNKTLTINKPGIYSVTVTDNNCKASASIKVTMNPQNFCPNIFKCGNSFVDPRDGYIYPTVQIGTQCWLKVNLHAAKYINGDTIPYVTDDSAWSGLNNGAYCDYFNVASNAITYGHLYNWYAVMDNRGLCPVGWYVPTHNDWTTLERAICTSSTCETDFPYDNYTTGWQGTNEGGKLKEAGKSHWESPNSGATNSSGFTALPNGCRDSDGTFNLFWQHGDFWSATQNDDATAWGRGVQYNVSNILRVYDSKNDGMAVRCLRNN